MTIANKGGHNTAPLVLGTAILCGTPQSIPDLSDIDGKRTRAAATVVNFAPSALPKYLGCLLNLTRPLKSNVYRNSGALRDTSGEYPQPSDNKRTIHSSVTKTLYEPQALLQAHPG